MEEALHAKLLANVAVAAMAKKIVWVERPQGSLLPAITLTEIAPGRRYTHSGWDGLNAGWVQFDLWGASEWECLQLKRLIVAEMEIETEHLGWHLGPSFLDAERNMEPEKVDGVGLIHRISQDWRIMNRPIEE